jgi:hypothetical protein
MLVKTLLKAKYNNENTSCGVLAIMVLPIKEDGHLSALIRACGLIEPNAASHISLPSFELAYIKRIAQKPIEVIQLL